MWHHSESGGWFFVSIPQKLSTEIRTHFKNQEEGWGRMKVTAIVNELKWKTSIWFDSKSNHYLLPIKAEIRKKGNFKVGNILVVNIFI